MGNIIEVAVFVFKLYRKYKSPITICNELDSVYPVPRPTDTPFLPPYQAVQALISVGTRMFTIGVASVIGLVCWLLAFYFLQWSFFSVAGIVLMFLLLGTLLIAYSEAKQLPLAYQRTQQRVSQGTAYWMEPEMMEDAGILFDSEDSSDRMDQLVSRFFRLFGVKRERSEQGKVLPPEEGFLEMGRYGSKIIGLPWELSSRHLALFGKTGSGKSKTFFINQMRRWAKQGSVIALDPKGELMWQTGRYFRNVYRFNLVDPLDSDHWNFVPDCRDSAVAIDITSIILQLDPVNKKAGGVDPFWENAEALCLWALLMFLSSCRNADGSPMIPADLSRLISAPEEFATEEQIERAKKTAEVSPTRSFNVSLINDLMMSVPGEIGKEIKHAWGMFTIVKQEGHGNVLLGLGVRLRSFTTATVRSLAQPIGGKTNARWISFKELRQPGTAVFLIVNEGDTATYQGLLATFMGMATQALRKSGESKRDAKVLCLFDEAGNIPIWGLAELLGLGRGRMISVVCCYQTVNQIYSQYGKEKGDTILDLFTNYLFLPGATNQTAELITKLLDKTTTWSHTAVNVLGGSEGDNERSAEIGRELMTVGEVRQLVEYKQALAIVSTLPPIKLAFPKFAFDADLPKFKIEGVAPKKVSSAAVLEDAVEPEELVEAVEIQPLAVAPAPPVQKESLIDFLALVNSAKPALSSSVEVASPAATDESPDAAPPLPPTPSPKPNNARLIKATPPVYDQFDEDLIERDPTLL